MGSSASLFNKDDKGYNDEEYSHVVMSGKTLNKCKTINKFADSHGVLINNFVYDTDNRSFNEKFIQNSKYWDVTDIPKGSYRVVLANQDAYI